MAHQGIKTRNACISVIFREKLAIDEHLKVLVLLFEIDGDPGRQGNCREQYEGKSKVVRAHGVIRGEVKQGDLPGGSRNPDCFADRFGPT